MLCADDKDTGKAPSRNGFGSSRADSDNAVSSSFGEEEEVVSARLSSRVACLSRAGKIAHYGGDVQSSACGLGRRLSGRRRWVRYRWR